MTDEELLEQALKDQIPEAPETPVEEKQQEEQPKSEAAQYLGKKLGYDPTKNPLEDKEGDRELIEKKNLSKIGENIFEKNEIREGWIPVDKALLGQRAIYYPEDWEFKIRPATVEAIRNWSNIDDENVNSVDEVFNEIIKSCLSISGPGGRLLPWGNISSWDRFYFLLLIQEFTFRHGEQKIKYTDFCPECNNEIEFELNSASLMYDYPDEEVMKYYSQEDRCWYIDPAEFGLEGYETIKLYIPTLEKDANIKAWMISQLQENRNKKFDQTFLRFANWLAPKIAKDETIAKRQIREIEMKYKSWDTNMFSFMDDVLRNIIVTPSNKLTLQCPICGEEVTSQIRFPNSIRDLFKIQGQYRKFGQK